MRIVMATVIGVTAANAGFGAGLVGTILAGPWVGAMFGRGTVVSYPAITMGFAVGAMAMVSSIAAALHLGRRLSPARVRR